MIEVKNCPFCGREAHNPSSVNYGINKWKTRITCNCGWSVEEIGDSRVALEKSVAARWNSVVVHFDRGR